MSKNIVICCDGTANQFGKNNTNVVAVYNHIIADEKQPNFYGPGVGTSSRQLLRPVRSFINIILQATGLDLNLHVEDAYKFIMNNYEDGDRIFLFGFSRGAHTARRLAYILGNIGLLWRGSDNMIPYVIRLNTENKDPEIINNFKEIYTKKCPVHFLGVWDTVSALKLQLTPKLDGHLHPDTIHAYHAVSIDEKRIQFPPSLFQPAAENQTVEEVWFAGVHSDVGGFYDERGLSNISLKWLLQKAEAKGLRIYDNAIESIDANPLGKKHNSWKGLFWFIPWHMYILIFFIALWSFDYIFCLIGYDIKPFKFSVRLASTYWYALILIFTSLIFFTKKQRELPLKISIHRSVKKRMDETSYAPRNLRKCIEKGKINWVD